MNCKNCRFWGFTAIGSETRGIADYHTFDCRRHSPIIGGEMGITAWPQTKGRDGCGDFELLPELRPCKTCDKLVGSEAFSAPHLQHATLYPICKECYDHFMAGTHPFRQEKKQPAVQCSHQFVNSDYHANAYTCAKCGAALEPVGTKDWKVKA